MDRSAEKLAALQGLWDTYCSIYGPKGLDIAAKCAKWSEQKRQTLSRYHSERFDDLCKDGCKTLPLAIVMAIVAPLCALEKQWTKITGTPRKRGQKIRTIEKAAGVLEDLLGSLPDIPGADNSGSTYTDGLQELPLEFIVLDPANTIYALKAYISILLMFEVAQKRTGVASSEMLAKYLFSAYVYRATGRFHDSEVSDLIGSALSITYDETAHGEWRKRNYRRIDKKLSGTADILAGLGRISIT
jgi:hypothetical protein